MYRFNFVADKIRSETDKIKQRMLDEIKEGCPVIFGAGNCGHKIYDLLQVYAISVQCFCDNKRAGNIDETTGLKIISPEDMRNTIKNPAILVCVADREACEVVHNQLQLFGFEKTQIHIMNKYFYWQTQEFFERNIEKYKRAYLLMDDDFSRRVYLEKMKKIFLLSDISDIVSPYEEEYFDKKVMLTDDEVFVDCGGFDGDTSRKFIEQCGNKYKDIIIFEPEACKNTMIKKSMGGSHYKLYQLGVWSKNAKLCFNALGTVSSHISEKGKYEIETVSLDELVYDKRPTYIKMDIEGAEQEALKGCREIICAYKPKLAICIYHKPEDMYEIPIMIKEMNPDYQLFVRQYANAWCDTVLYAI